MNSLLLLWNSHLHETRFHPNSTYSGSKKPISTHQPQLSPVSVEGGLVVSWGEYRLLGVHRDGRPHALVRTLQGFVVGREDVQVAGHSGRSEVRQVLATLFLLLNFPLVAIPTGVPPLRTAGRRTGEAGWKNIWAFRRLFLTEWRMRE